MDKKKKWLKITLGIMALVIVGVYIGGIAAFHGKFLKNTDINGMDVSDMTVEEAEKLIREQAEDYQITLKERGNNSETITAEEIGYHYVSNGEIENFQKSQPYALWFVSYFRPASYAFETAVQYDETLLKEKADSLKCFDKATAKAPEDAKMVFQESENKYVIKKEKQGAKLKQKKFWKLLTETISERDGLLDLEKESCYQTPKVTSDDKDLNQLVENLNHYVDIEITYCFGNQKEVLDGSVVKDWLTYDKKGKVLTQRSHSVIPALKDEDIRGFR